ncbi:MAG: nuclear transport factor 2 family protein [Solimonas sp.]
MRSIPLIMAALLGGFAVAAPAQTSEAVPAAGTDTDGVESKGAVAEMQGAVTNAAATDAAATPAETTSTGTTSAETAPVASDAVPSDAATNPSAVTPGPAAPVKAAPGGAEAADAAQATAVVASFHQSLRENYRKGALATLAPDVAIFEQGFAESSRDEYGAGHLDNDLLFAATTRYEVLHREAAAGGDTAWVITQARITGTFAGQDIDLDHTETAVLERRGGHWLIVHLHWSAHPRGGS